MTDTPDQCVDGVGTGVHLHQVEAKMSVVLGDVAASLPDEPVEVRMLLELLGEQGLLMTCIFLSLPFLIPVSIPGISTVFGFLVVLISIGVTLDRLPWLPKRLLDRKFSGQQLKALLVRSRIRFERVERIVRPRLLVLTATGAMNRLNGIVLIVSGLLLMVPFSFIPFSNTLPGLAVMLIAIGLLERDGVFLVAGYLMTIATIAYFFGLAWAGWAAGGGVYDIFFAPGFLVPTYIR